MNKVHKSAVILCIFAAACFNAVQTTTACSFDTYAEFTYSNHPDFPLRQFAAGHLGVLRPGYARSYLLVAYKFLSGKPLSKEEQEHLTELWIRRLTQYMDCNTDTSGWLEARKSVPDATKIDEVSIERPVSEDQSWQTFCNCQGPAFEQARGTLEELQQKFGKASKEVKEWLKAQDQVFSNCSESNQAAIPSPLAKGANDLLVKHRTYQIAAANFYAMNYTAARSMFTSIAADDRSPWAETAKYMIVRTMLREATLGKLVDKNLLQQALKRIEQLASDPSFKTYKEDLVHLKYYALARIAPEALLSELIQQPLQQFTAGEFTKTMDLLLNTDELDVQPPKYSSVPASLKKPDVSDWILAFQSNDQDALARSLQRWKESRSLPWLVAVAKAIPAAHPDAAAVLSAAEKERSPYAKWSLLTHQARLLTGKGKLDEARSLLDTSLANPPATLLRSSLNELRTRRLPLSRNLDEFAKFGIQTPVTILTTGMIQGVPDDVAELEKGKIEKLSPLFTPEAGYVLNNQLPLSTLTSLAVNKSVPAELKSNLAWTSWVRAVLIGEDQKALQLATIMRPYNKARQKLIDDYLAAKSPAERKFAAAFMMLQFSSARPNATWGVLTSDGYGDDSGWWWSGNPVTKTSFDADLTKFEPLFLTPAEKQQALSEVARLSNVQTAPTYLTKAVLERAKSNPEDPRLPQALHLAVKSTRYGAVDESTKGLSKQAFQLLHSKYKTNPWTKKTPYFY